MINSSSSMNTYGAVLNSEDFIKTFAFKNNDKFSQWVIRPLAALTAIGLGVAACFARVFLVVLSLALIPLLALSFWALKTKVERDIASKNAIASTQNVG
ncbi:MAG: hypothetical protein AB8B97_13885 [Granulosicoccus sp.]